jgi:cytochrome c peroxidase
MDDPMFLFAITSFINLFQISVFVLQRSSLSFSSHELSWTTLQEQALGAFNDHAQAAVVPPQQLLDDLSSFQRVLFTNHRVRALGDAVREGTVPLPDPDRPLNTREQEGKVVFQRACAQCHGGAGQSTPEADAPGLPGPVVRFHSIASGCPRPVDPAGRWSFAACAPQLARNERTYELTLANGTTTRRTSADPGRALLTGFVGVPIPQDDWDKFDIPGLRGISKTAPYFHNNSAATLEAMVDHYIEFFKRVEANWVVGTPIPPIATTDGLHFDRRPAAEEREALLAYLRKL